MKNLVIAIVLAAAVLASASTAEAATPCSAPVRTFTGYESYMKFSNLVARAGMNCSSARYAYGIAVAKHAPRTFSDGYVTWHRSLVKLGGTTTPGCGNATFRVTYSEATSGTVFSFRLYASGC